MSSSREVCRFDDVFGTSGADNVVGPDGSELASPGSFRPAPTAQLTLVPPLSLGEAPIGSGSLKQQAAAAASGVAMQRGTAHALSLLKGPPHVLPALTTLWDSFLENVLERRRTAQAEASQHEPVAPGSQRPHTILSISRGDSEERREEAVPPNGCVAAGRAFARVRAGD